MIACNNPRGFLPSTDLAWWNSSFLHRNAMQRWHNSVQLRTSYTTQVLVAFCQAWYMIGKSKWGNSRTYVDWWIKNHRLRKIFNMGGLKQLRAKRANRALARGTCTRCSKFWAQKLEKSAAIAAGCWKMGGWVGSSRVIRLSLFKSRSTGPKQSFFHGSQPVA